MKEFFRELFTWNGRWNRLKFWLYPLTLIIPFFLIMTTISFMSLSWYTDQASELKVSSDISLIVSKINILSARWINIESIKGENNDINYTVLWENENFFNPFSDEFGEYKIFIKDQMFQVYWETPNKIIIEWNYYQNTENDPISLVNINWEIKKNGLKNNDIKKSKSNIIDIIWPSILFVLSILFFYISYASYVKRLRDLDKNPWMSLLMFIPFANIYLLIICGFFKWTVWPNRYWSDPLNPNMSKEEVVEL
jgi:uncharacterized membrane protein YhaH (DUF805 family)